MFFLDRKKLVYHYNYDVNPSTSILIFAFGITISMCLYPSYVANAAGMFFALSAKYNFITSEVVRSAFLSIHF